MQAAKLNNLLPIGACAPANLTEDVILEIKIDAVAACLKICANQVVEGMTEIHRLADLLGSLGIAENDYQDEALLTVYKLARDIHTIQIENPGSL